MPYVRTAIGVNISQQNFNNGSGNQTPYDGSSSSLSYQLSIGSKFFFNKHSGVFIEAGYGKYILQGGLAFRF
jgi:hypothetical protein